MYKENWREQCARYVQEGRTVSGGHDNPGIKKFDVTSPTFDADVDAALNDGYKAIGSPGTFLVLARGYDDPKEPGQ